MILFIQILDGTLSYAIHSFIHFFFTKKECWCFFIINFPNMKRCDHIFDLSIFICWNNKWGDVLKLRDSNFELLRIIAILFITFNHINTYCNVNSLDTSIPMNLFLSLLFGVGGKFGCNIFLLISAYFLTKSSFKIEGCIQIALQTFFYMYILDIISAIVAKEHLTLTIMIRQMVQIILGQSYWYSHSYTVFLFMVPVLKTIMDRVKNKKQFLLVGGFLLCILPTVTFEYELFMHIHPTVALICRLLLRVNVAWFCYVFCVVYYIRCYTEWKANRPNWVYAVCFLLSYIVMTGLFILFFYLGKDESFQYASFFSSNYSKIRNMSSLPCIMSAVFLFLFIKNIKLQYSALINHAASLMYGVYLFQTHELFRKWLYGDILPFHEIYESSWLYLLFSTIFVLGVVICGCIFDILRMLVEKFLFKHRFMERLIFILQNIFDSLYAKFFP